MSHGVAVSVQLGCRRIPLRGPPVQPNRQIFSPGLRHRGPNMTQSTPHFTLYLPTLYEDLFFLLIRSFVSEI